MSEMAKAAGNATKAADFASKAAGLRKAMVDKMWNGSAFCDGICSEVGGNSRFMSNMFTLWMGFVPQKDVELNWNALTRWGIYQVGDYGAFWYLNAIGGSYYTLPNALYTTPASDDGSEVLKALAKCDHFSWCSEIRDDNATMTRESWHDGTYSHPWGTGAVMGVVSALMGIHQTAPGFATFSVKPKLGGLTSAKITVPTLRGYINVDAKPGSVQVGVPCNTAATLCLPRSAHDAGAIAEPRTHALLLDGVEVGAEARGGHLCTQQPVSCGAGGAPRALTARRR